MSQSQTRTHDTVNVIKDPKTSSRFEMFQCLGFREVLSGSDVKKLQNLQATRAGLI